MPTKSLGCWAVPLTPASPTMPIAKPAASPLRPTLSPAPRWRKLLRREMRVSQRKDVDDQSGLIFQVMHECNEWLSAEEVRPNAIGLIPQTPECQSTISCSSEQWIVACLPTLVSFTRKLIHTSKDFKINTATTIQYSTKSQYAAHINNHLKTCADQFEVKCMFLAPVLEVSWESVTSELSCNGDLTSITLWITGPFLCPVQVELFLKGMFSLYGRSKNNFKAG